MPGLHDGLMDSVQRAIQASTVDIITCFTHFLSFPTAMDHCLYCLKHFSSGFGISSLALFRFQVGCSVAGLRR